MQCTRQHNIIVVDTMIQNDTTKRKTTRGFHMMHTRERGLHNLFAFNTTDKII